MKRWRGFTLLELMLALLIGTVLLGVLMQIFITSQKIFTIQQDLIALQNDANILQNVLQSEIRLAGYIGCSRLTADFPVASSVVRTITSATKIMGTKSDITILHANYFHTELIYPMSDLTTLAVQSANNYKPENILILTDCKSADLFQVSQVSNQVIKALMPLSRSYEARAQLSRFEVNHFYLIKNNHSTADLIVENIQGEKSHLLSNITKLNFEYTLAVNGKFIDCDASEVTDWSKVVGVQTTVEFALHHIKQVWSFYTALR